MIVGLVLMSFFFMACDLFDDPSNVNFEIVSEGSSSGVSTKSELVIDTQPEWQALWEQHTSRVSTKPPLPMVDFGTSVIVAIFGGDKPDSCYRLFLREVSKNNSDVTVRYEIVKTPADACLLVITQPFTMIRILKPQGSIRIIEQR